MFHRPSRPCVAAAALTCLLWMAGCASRPPAEAADAAPVAAEQTAAASQVSDKILPVADRAHVQATPLAINPDPGSYAHRDDARALAQQLAQRHQLDPGWAAAVLGSARVNDKATRLMMPAASPSAKNWGAYRSRFIEPIRVRAGVAFWKTHQEALLRAEAVYGVPADIIAGVIGVETIYGRYTGNFRVLDVLTTLSLDFPKGRSDRSAFFQDELGHFLRLCAEQGDEPSAVLGSFAGAIGLPQFMPSSIRRFAVDFDGDGHIDLRNSPVDAIGSVAHYLLEHGWQRGMPTHYAVSPPSDDTARNQLLGPDILPSFTAMEMAQSGATLDADGRSHAALMALVMLHNAGAQPTYIAGTDNFYAITRYNQSSYYALAVIELGQAVAQAARANP